MTTTPSQTPAMIMRCIVGTVAASVLLASSGCDPERRSVAAPGPQLAPETATLQSSVADPLPGTDVTVTASIAPIQHHDLIGSFSLTLGYNPAAIEFLGEVPLDAGLRAMNGADPGVVRVAGANADGYGDGRLFAVKLRVLRRGALSTLDLRPRQLGGVKFGNRLLGLSIDRTVRPPAR